MRICKNDITDYLRKELGANPVKIPESRIVPLLVLEIVDKKPRYLGQLKYLVKNDHEINVPINDGVVSDISNKKTKSIDLKIGLKILNGFMKALGGDGAAIGAALKSNKEMAFTFNNVTTKYFDILQLWKMLNDKEIIAQPANLGLGDDFYKSDLGLVTRVIQSNSFSITAYKNSDVNGEINIPLIENYIANADLKFNVKSENASKITFNSEEKLTFAFTCVELKIEESTNRILRGEWIDNLRSKAAGAESKVYINGLDFDVPLAEPELLEL